MTTTATESATSSPTNNEPAIKRWFAHVAVADIAEFPYNYRADFNPELLADLAESIQQQGIVEPLILKREGCIYVGIAGERRWKAAKKVGLKEVPAIVYDETLSDAQAIEIALVENLQRKDVNPIEEARGYRMLKGAAGLTQEAIAHKVGRPRSTVANTIRLLDLPESVQDLIATGKLTKAHGIALLRFRGYEDVITRIAELAVEQDTPAGDLETGLPFSNWLHNEGLAYIWAHWHLNSNSSLREWLDQYRAGELDDGWVVYNRVDGDDWLTIAVIGAEHTAKVLAALKAAADAQQQEADAADQQADDAGDDEDVYDPEAAERQARKVDPFVQERLKRFETALKRYAEWRARHDSPKGPTRASRLSDWEGAIKAALYLAGDSLADNFRDMDAARWSQIFGNVPQTDNTEEIERLIFSLPVNALIEAILTDDFDGYNPENLYGFTRCEDVVNLLEGKPLQVEAEA